MKGRARILLCVLALVLICSALSAGQKIYQLPTMEKLLRPGSSTVKYDRTAYCFYNNEPIAITFTKLNDQYTELKVEVVGPVPTTIVTLWWDAYPFNTLTVDSGGDNTWTLDSETGYAEK